MKSMLMRAKITIDDHTAEDESYGYTISSSHHTITCTFPFPSRVTACDDAIATSQKLEFIVKEFNYDRKAK